MKFFNFTAVTLTLASYSVLYAKDKPNILIIVADDYGYSDSSFNPFHSPEVSTPNIDRLAKSGVTCTDGYVTAHISSATRAGLMTGRYQQRYGLYTAGEAGSGLDMSAKIIPQYLKEQGYTTGQFGKWHLGPDIQWSPYKRGFDYQFGFLGRGAHDYFYLNDPKDPIYRNDVEIEEKGYLTDRLGEEVVDFISRNKENPFFAYLAFNAVHSPMQAPEKDIALFNTPDTTRNIMLAMIHRMDEAIGKVLDKLEEDNLRDNTLIFFISDNGGELKLKAENKPFNGGKHMDYEGGIHVPFLVSWPSQLEQSICSTPVISLDILPTILAALGQENKYDMNSSFDGKNILPLLKGNDKIEDRVFYWSGGSLDPWWAIRKDDWKVVGNKDKRQLFNLKKDIGEKTDLSEQYPEKMKELVALHNAWLEKMADPVNKANYKRWSKGRLNKSDLKREKKNNE